MHHSKSLTRSESGLLLGLKFRSYQEYLAARCLFHNNHVEQAVILSNTCVEKQLKAILVGLSIKFRFDHNTPQLLDDLRAIRPKLAAKINIKYLERIKRIYDFRYFSRDIIGLNYVISRNYYLAELDYTFSILEPITKIEKPGEIISTSGYEQDLRERMKALYENNYILNNFKKERIFDGSDFILAGIVTEDYEIYNAEGTGPMNEFFNRFDGDGIEITGDTYKVIMPPDLPDTTFVANYL